MTLDEPSPVRRSNHSAFESVVAPQSFLPEEGNRYLRHDNLHLLQLAERYSRWLPAALNPSQWTNDFVQQDVNLSQFRQDSAYMWQHRDNNLLANYISTYEYLVQSANRDLLELCTEDDLFGVYAVSHENELLTRDRLDSVCEISFLRRMLNLTPTSKFKVLDIGSGYGRLAHRAIQCFPYVKMLCVDVIPTSSFLCEFYLNFRGVNLQTKMVQPMDLETALQSGRVDLAIAINSLTECPSDTTAWWLTLLRKYGVKYFFLVPNAFLDGGRDAISIERDVKEASSLITMLQEFGYKCVASEPKYDDPLLQKFGISPTFYHLFELRMV